MSKVACRSEVVMLTVKDGAAQCSGVEKRLVSSRSVGLSVAVEAAVATVAPIATTASASEAAAVS